MFICVHIYKHIHNIKIDISTHDTSTRWGKKYVNIWIEYTRDFVKCLYQWRRNATNDKRTPLKMNCMFLCLTLCNSDKFDLNGIVILLLLFFFLSDESSWPFCREKCKTVGLDLFYIKNHCFYSWFFTKRINSLMSLLHKFGVNDENTIQIVKFRSLNFT